MASLTIRLFIADGQRLFREGLAAMLADHEGIVVVGEAESGAESVRTILELRPDAAVLGNSLSGPDAYGVSRRLADAGSATAVVILTAASGPEALARARSAGARGCLPKDRPGDDLVEALRRVAGGDYYPAELADPAIAGLGGAGGVMTAREREVAVLLADGYSTKEVAAVLGIGVRTAETHRAAILRKLGARNVTDVVKYCIRNRLIDL